MLFLNNHQTESCIIKSLQQGGLTGPQIIEEIKKIKPAITRQAVYAALRRMMREEIITKAKQRYTVNRLWVKDMSAFAQALLHETDARDLIPILDLKDGDKIVYTFQDPLTMDRYWGHIFDSVLKAHDSGQPIFVYYPHDWMWYARPQTEAFFLEQFERDQVLCFLSIGGKTPMDKLFKERWHGDMLQINIGKTYSLKNNTMINILGDFLFEVTIDQNLARAVETIYTHDYPEETVRERIQKLITNNYKTKLVLTRNKKRAQSLAKKIAKDFYFPKGYRL